MKRGQGLQLNTIILAALGIIVLVILVVLVQNQVTKTSTGVKTVTEQECPPAQIKDIGECDDIIYGSFKGLPAGKVCCRATQ